MARAIVRHHKKIILIWIALLVVAIPFAPMADEAVVYDDTAGAEDLQLESIEGQRWIDDNFSGSSGSSSIILVIVSPDSFDADTRELVFELTSEMVRASPFYGGDFENNATVQSVYSVTSQYATAYLMEANAAYYELFNELNSTRYLVFGLPSMYRELYNDTADAQELLFGLPASYRATWEIANLSMPGAPVDLIDALAYDQVRTAVESSLSMNGANEGERALTLSYLFHFSSAWNSTAHDAGLNTSSGSRLEASLTPGWVQFSNDVPFLSLPDDEQTFLSIIFISFNFENYDDLAIRNEYTGGMFATKIDGLAAELPAELGSLCSSYFEHFHDEWSSDLDGVNETEYRDIVSDSVELLVSSLPPEEAPYVQLLFNVLPWDGWEDDAQLKVIVTDIIADRTMMEKWLINEVADAGKGVPVVQLSILAEKVVQNRSLADFPLPLVPAMVEGFINLPKNDTMLVLISFRGEDGELVSASDDVPRVREIAASVLDGNDDFRIFVTGSDAIGQDMERSVNDDMERIDPFTIVLVLVLIGLYFRSFVASAVPPAIIGFGLGIAYAMVYFLGTYVLSINYTLLTLLLTSMLGAGCDYCIFLLSRYREERKKGASKEQAVETSVTWAGEAIATSGLTVIIGFGALSLGSLDVMRSMGLLAIGIICALLLALTLLPSVLMLLGDRMFWPSRMGSRPSKKNRGYFTRSARFAIKHAKAILVVSLLISIPASYLAVSLETSYDFIGTMPETESKKGLTQMSEGFGGGKITPTEVGVELRTSIFNSTGGWDIENMGRIESLCTSLSELANVNKVTSPTRPYGAPIDYSSISGNRSIEAMLYDQIMRTMVGSNTTAVLVTVIFDEEPFAPVSIGTIEDMREVTSGFIDTDQGFKAIYVSGGTAMMFDVASMTQDDFRTIIFVVVVLIYIVLLLVLGSVINPLRSILTILLSISWTLAATMIIFEYVFGQTINWLVPLILLVICLGLGMDYDILLSTRVREETHRGRSNNEAIIYSVEQTGGIITACGIIMAGAFGTMMLSQGWLLREFGFALMFAILLDATIVRIYMVPAIMSLLGKWNWWAPGRLKRTMTEHLSENEKK